MSLDPQLVAIIVAIGALVVPPCVSFLKREHWPAQVKQLIALVLSCGVVAIALYIEAPKDFGLPFMSLAALVFAGSQIIYGVYFKSSAADTFLTSIGSIVSAAKAVHPSAAPAPVAVEPPPAVVEAPAEVPPVE